MSSADWLWSAMAIQALAMGVDEFYFHQKRGLPKWERVGHPVDTAGLLACLGVGAFLPFTFSSLILFCALSLISCLLVTKDEWVHVRECSGGENWVHAILFIVHPLVLLSWLIGWLGGSFPGLARVWFGIQDTSVLRDRLELFFWIGSAFLVYQVVFWNWIWKPRSITASTTS